MPVAPDEGNGLLYESKTALGSFSVCRQIRRTANYERRVLAGAAKTVGHKNFLHQGTVAYGVVRGYTVTVPTVLRIDGLRFFFYSGDREEPVHVHVEENSELIVRSWNEFFGD